MAWHSAACAAVTDDATRLYGEQRAFATTRWSVVLCAGNGVGRSREALAQLCQLYWRPIFAFICRKGYEVPDAQDLTQEFFFKIVHGDVLSMADPARGRFRSLLRKALQNFLADADRKRASTRRGGEMQFISWDEWMAEVPSHLILPEEAMELWTAERLFDVRWAATVVEQALRRLREECEARGRRRVLETLSPALMAEREDISYDKYAQLLDAPLARVKRLVYQLRVRYRELLRDEVAETVESPSEIDDEIRYLCAALTAATE